MSWESPIVRIPSGYLNGTDDLYPGGGTALNKFGGQLGQQITISSAQAAQLSKASVGTLYAGTYQYVKLKAGATPAVRGAAYFWDNAAAAGSFQVVTIESSTTLTAASLAGVCLNTITAGNYGWIQTAGIATCKFVASITGTAATGRPVFISVAGTTSIGLFDVVDDLTTTAGARFFDRFVGWAITVPVASELDQVQLTLPMSPRG